jgi:hypothetical integral membrane protein (TIGR02206 family)
MSAGPLVADGFEAFTPEHAALLALLVAGAIVLGRVGVRHSARADPRFRRGFAIVIPVFTVPFQVLQLLPGDFDLGTSLPLQICDLSWMVAVWALWTLDSRAVALLYFWGLTLTVQAAITPSLDQTFPDPRYFMFWGMHFLTIWSAVYLVCLVGGPSWRGYRLTLGATAAPAHHAAGHAGSQVAAAQVGTVLPEAGSPVSPLLRTAGLGALLAGGVLVGAGRRRNSA